MAVSSERGCGGMSMGDPPKIEIRRQRRLRRSRQRLVVCKSLFAWLSLAGATTAQLPAPRPPADREAIKLMVNQPATEWIDSVFSGDGHFVAFSSNLTNMTQLVDLRTHRTVASVAAGGALAISD